MGYGHGSTQAFYGLATREAQFWDRFVDKVIALGPCFIIRDGITNYQTYFDELSAAQVDVIYGPDWDQDYARLCSGLKPAQACKDLKDYRALPQPRSVKDYKVSA